MMNKEHLILQLEALGVDPKSIIKESFLGYKYRKSNGKLYESDAVIPTRLIRMYYNLNPDKVNFNNMKQNFVKKYVLNESKLEGINDSKIHGQQEIEGFAKMYEYIHSDEIDYMFNIYTLKELHKELFSCTPHPECAGDFRTIDVYLPGTGTEISEWSMIRPRLNELDDEVLQLYDLAKEIRNSNDVDLLLDYLDRCVVLNCKLIKIHPFFDGNGRTIRGFTNKLLEEAGLPSIFIKADERSEYHKAMNKANNEGDYSDIKSFYRYKVCDSIIELDINPWMREEYKEVSYTVKQKNK